jgi:hypothetical protein
MGPAFNLAKPFALEHGAQTRDIGLADDNVEVVVWAGLLADQSVNAPAAIKPHRNRSALQATGDLHNVVSCHHGASSRR